jgi:hypothetical protein
MEPARHHDADLTFDRHAHTRLEDLSKVVDRLPDLRVSHTLPTSAVSEGPNGTTSNHRESSPERSQVAPSGHTDRFQRLVAASTQRGFGIDHRKGLKTRPVSSLG